MDARKHKKKKDKYTLMLVPKKGGSVRQFEVSPSVVKAAAAVVLIAVFALIVYVSYGLNTIRKTGSVKEALSGQVAKLSEENSDLKEQYEELKKQLEEIPAAAQQEQEEAGPEGQEQEESGAVKEEETQAPSGFPLNGTATVTANFGDEIQVQGAEGEGDAEEPVTRKGIAFHAENGTSIIASGGGKVIFAGEDDDKEGFLVKIDHGNGYVTCYHNASPILTKEGDTVEKGAVLYKVEGDNGTLGYEVILNGEYIDPMGVMEVNG